MKLLKINKVRFGKRTIPSADFNYGYDSIDEHYLDDIENSDSDSNHE